MRTRNQTKPLVQAFLLVLSLTLVPACQDPAFPWDPLRNPIFGYTDASVKDVCVKERAGKFYLFFSYITETGPWTVQFHVRGVWTRDFLFYTDPIISWTQPGSDDAGFASPDIIQVGDTYYMGLNSHTSDPNYENVKPYISTSADLFDWTDKDYLGINNFSSEDRVIDTALAYEDGSWYCGYKIGAGIRRVFKVMRTDEEDPVTSTNWHTISGEIFDNQENGQFLKVDGTWFLLTTSTGFDHTPTLWEMDAAPGEIDFTSWKPVEFTLAGGVGEI